MALQRLAGAAGSGWLVCRGCGGTIAHGIAQPRRGDNHHCGAYLASGPTLAWASSTTKSTWRRRAGAMRGGTDASLQWRSVRVITDACVMAAMQRRAPRRHKGHVARARAQTRPSSLTQSQDGMPVCVFSPSTSCWREVEISRLRAGDAALNTPHSAPDVHAVEARWWHVVRSDGTAIT
jgi:hypothetical protein